MRVKDFTTGRLALSIISYVQGQDDRIIVKLFPVLIESPPRVWLVYPGLVEQTQQQFILKAKAPLATPTSLSLWVSIEFEDVGNPIN